MARGRPVLRYHGGKWLFARVLIGLFPSHRIYVEPFSGAASVFMQKPRSYGEVLNDKWDVVVNVFQCLRDPVKSEQLKESLRLTPFSRTEFNLAFGHRPKFPGDVEAARLCILRSFAGFGSASTNGDYATGFRSNSNRSGTTPAQDWMHYPDSVAGFVERLRGVVIENKDALEVIPQQDGLDTLFYCDPPYVLGTRNVARGNAAYSCDMTDDDHRRFAQVIKAVRGMVVLSGYACPLYDCELFPDWHRKEFSWRADGARKRVEVIWMNEAVACRVPQLEFDKA
jgi:DNA adenine methylase